MADVAAIVVEHFRRHGAARALPWRATRDPYAIWVCEIMAQQTRLETVIPYWRRWMARFPDPRALAAAPLDDVLHAWAGLGYYSRARSLHAAAREVVARHGGALPDDLEAIGALPGIGPYTAGAIASIAFGRRAAVVDGNVVRVLARLHAVRDDATRPATRKTLWRLAEALVPADAPGEFNQGLMDLGATICTPRAPRCLACPLHASCAARKKGLVDEIPLLPRRREVPRVEVDAAWIVDAEGRWLLCRRAPKGLFGGLWELPEAASLPGVRLGVKVAAEHTHKLTHRTITYRVHPARLAGTDPCPAAPYDDHRFVSPDDLGTLGVSSATSALAARLQLHVAKETSWPTPNARTSSSKKASTRSSGDSPSSATRSTRTRTSARRRGAPPAVSPR